MISACAATHQDRAQQFYSQAASTKRVYEIQQALTRDPNNLSTEHLAAQIFHPARCGSLQARRNDRGGQLFPSRPSITIQPTGPAYDYLGLIAFLNIIGKTPSGMVNRAPAIRVTSAQLCRPGAGGASKNPRGVSRW